MKKRIKPKWVTSVNSMLILLCLCRVETSMYTNSWEENWKFFRDKQMYVCAGGNGKFNWTFPNLQKLKENLSIIHKVVAVLFYHLLFIFFFSKRLYSGIFVTLCQCKIIVMDVLLLSVGRMIILVDSTHDIRDQQ